ncbi:MAG: hypothetical protein WD716_07700 [Fimbriimonadaceae bacterium]
MTTLLLALAIAQPQTISFSHPCAHSSVVLEALGKELGVTMKPSGSVSQDYFLVHLTDVPKQEALDKIAATLNATWNEKDGVTYLGRTHAQDLEDAKAERDADMKLVQQWLDKRQIKDEYTTEFAKKLVEAVIPLMKESENPGTNSYQRMQEYEVHAPTMRLLVRIIKEIGVEKIVDLGDDDKMTYVYEPNAFQRKLPKGPAFQMYEKEHAVHKALFEQGIYGDLAPNIGYYSDLVSPYTDRYFTNRQTSLVCERTDMGLSVRLQIETGGTARATINANEFQTQYIPEELRKLEGKYEPTPIETEIASKAALLFGGGGAGSATVDQQTAAVLRDPVANEPLSVLGSRWITDTSKALGKNCVALLSDEMYFVPFACIAQGNSSYAFMWSILPQIDKIYDIKLEEKWFTVAPSRRVEVRNDRIDREKWGGLLRTGRPGTPMTLEHTAGFASLSDNEITVIISVLPAILTGMDVSLDAFSGREGVDALRLFGGLTATQQKAARNGGTEVPLAGLNARMSRAARRIVFGANSSVTKDKVVPNWESGQYFYGPGVDNDPDKLLGQGAPNGSIVRLYVVEGEVVYPRPPGPGYRAQGYRPDEYGRQRAHSESRNVGQETDYGFAIVAKADLLIVEFEFPGIGFVYNSLQFDRVPRNAEYKPIKDLPEAVRTAIETSYKATADAIKKAGGGGGGG